MYIYVRIYIYTLNTSIVYWVRLLPALHGRIDRRRGEPWPLHDIATADIVWCMANTRGVRWALTRKSFGVHEHIVKAKVSPIAMYICNKVKYIYLCTHTRMYF